MAYKKRSSRGIIEDTRTAYNFVDRDPVMDFVQNVVKDSGLSYQEIRDGGGAAVSTIRSYCNRGSSGGRTGRFDCLMATIRASGGDLLGVTPAGIQVVIGKPKAKAKAAKVATFAKTAK